MLAAHIADAGFTLERGGCGGANGYTNHTTRTVRVRDDVDDNQAVKTLAHELGHVLLHDNTDRASDDRPRMEIEAESVAYLVCHQLGIVSDDYSFAYRGARRRTRRPRMRPEARREQNRDQPFPGATCTH